MSLAKSRYAQKVQARNQMYGPGKPGSCCAHKLEFVEVDYRNAMRSLRNMPNFTTERTRRVIR